MHRLIQAILAVTDLIQLRRPFQRFRFDAEVESLIISSGATYDVDFSVAGERQRHKFRFHVNSNRNLLVHTISAATYSSAFSWAERLAYRFGDIRSKSDHWRLAAVLDDRGGRAEAWSEAALVPIREHAILWSERYRLEEAISSIEVR